MGPSGLSAALLALALAGLVGCGGGDPEPGEGATLAVYVSAPLSGPAANEGQDVADGAELALETVGAEVGGYAIDAEVLDAAAGDRGWTPEQAAANARTALRDSTAIAYLGDFESGATRASLPVTNGGRLLQVSPASGAADLVSGFAGSEDVPEVQHTGERTFGRVIPSDDAQKETTTGWAGELGIPDRWAYDDDVVYGELVHASGRYATTAALAPGQLPPAGADFRTTFEERYGRAPGPYAAYGYEAMALILDTLERATDPADRQAVVEAFFDTSGRDSILGPYSITETGETTLFFFFRAHERIPARTGWAPAG